MIATIHPAPRAFQKQIINGCRVQLIQEGESDVFLMLIVDDRVSSNELPFRPRSLQIVIPTDAADSEAAWDEYAYGRCREIASQLPPGSL